jgi:transcriptional regulator with XRE-family HTH domain
MLAQCFGQVLQELRRERGISQEMLAFESGYHRTYISLLERGRKVPTLGTIFCLAQVLHMSPSEMLRLVELRMQETARGH